LQPHLLSLSRAVTSYKRRHHGDASSALQRIHHIYGTARRAGNQGRMPSWGPKIFLFLF